MSEHPACKCHGEPMRRQSDSRYATGGYYRCRVRDREYAANYYEKNGMTVRWRQWRHHHRLRLAELEAKV